MFRLYSKGCEYAIRALLQMGPARGRAKFAATDVCRRAGIPESFTRKIFQALVRGGFLSAVTGPGGGYALRRPPGQITLRRVIEAVDGEGAFRQCVLGLPVCGERRACPLHATWLKAKRPLLRQLDTTTLQDLLDTVTAHERGRQP